MLYILPGPIAPDVQVQQASVTIDGVKFVIDSGFVKVSPDSTQHTTLGYLIVMLLRRSERTILPPDCLPYLLFLSRERQPYNVPEEQVGQPLGFAIAYTQRLYGASWICPHHQNSFGQI